MTKLEYKLYPLPASPWLAKVAAIVSVFSSLFDTLLPQLNAKSVPIKTIAIFMPKHSRLETLNCEYFLNKLNESSFVQTCRPVLLKTLVFFSYLLKKNGDT